MEADVLNLLPPRGLDQSILLAVLMGLLVLLFLTETLGWVFAGLVVPGYLASVFVMSPGAGVAIVFEAIVTFILARALTAFVSKSEAGTQFFGRERFFIIVLVSVVVRQNSEIWFLPWLAPHLDAAFGTMFAAQRQLASIGLVLVPLTANMFWKHDLKGGLLQVGVPVGITFALLFLLVLPYTNLSYSSLELTYENTALDFLASPKAYIILLVGAYLASRFNLTYGWDYNGILVPALLSLTWMEPMRVLTTVIEAVVLLYATLTFLRLPTIRTLNFEGPRKVVLVFVIGFLLKYAFSWSIGDHAPTQRVTDLFGFGYLLPSLLATKMLQKKTVGRVLLPALETSLLAFILANLLGIGLDAVAPPKEPDISAPDQVAPYSTSILVHNALGGTMVARTRARLDSARIRPLEHRRAQLDYYESLWRDMDEALPGSDAATFRSKFSARANTLGLEMRRVATDSGREALLLMESEERLIKQAGWDTSLLFPGSSGPVIAVPRPYAQEDAAPGALWICERIQCRAIIMSGVDTRAAGVREGDALVNPRTSFNFAHRALERTSLVQLSVYDVPKGAADPGQPTLLLKGRLSSDIDFDRLWPEPILIQWENPSGTNIQWSERKNLAVLRVPAPVMARQLLEASAPLCAWPQPSLAAFLNEYLDAPRGPDPVRASVSTPCGWLADEVAKGDSPCRSEPAGTGAAAFHIAQRRQKPLTRRLLTLGRETSRGVHTLLDVWRDTTSGDGARPPVCAAESFLEASMRATSNAHHGPPLSETELVFMQKQLLIPLVHRISKLRDEPRALEARLRRTRQLARLVGYEIGAIADCDGAGNGCWVLAQRKNDRARSGVVVVIRGGKSKRLAIEVPKPDTEPGTWRIGFELWRRSKARILLVGVPVYGERVPSVARELRDKRQRIFHALHQGLDTALSTATKRGTILQIRGYGSWRQLDDDLVIGVGRSLLTWRDPADRDQPPGKPGPDEYADIDWLASDLPPRLKNMLSVDKSGLLLEFDSVRPADGAEEVIELRGPHNPQVAYSRRIGRTDVAVLWFSRVARSRYRPSGSILQCRELQRQGLLSLDDATRSIDAFLGQPALSPPPAQPSSQLARRAQELRESMIRAASFENIHLLRKLVLLDGRDENLRARAFADVVLGRPYLAIELRDGDEVYRMVALLGDDVADPVDIEADTDTNRLVSRALLRRSSPIVVHGTVSPDEVGDEAGDGREGAGGR